MSASSGVSLNLGPTVRKSLWVLCLLHMLQTVASFAFPHEAHIARARLEAEGIAAFVADEHTINMQGLYSQALGGVKVQVRERDVEAAKAILAHDYSADLAELEGEDLWCCPECGSSDVEPYTEGKAPAFLMFWLLHFPLWRTRKRFRCRDCGARFDDADDGRAG